LIIIETDGNGCAGWHQSRHLKTALMAELSIWHLAEQGREHFRANNGFCFVFPE